MRRGVCGIIAGAALAGMAVQGRNRHAHALRHVAHRQLALLHQGTRRSDVAGLECRRAPTFAATAACLGKAGSGSFANQGAFKLRDMRCTAYRA
jgi:hypothetical protein